MPFAFLIIGAMLLISGVRGQSNKLLSLVKADFTGKGNFIYWTVSILILGALGYISELRPVSRAFLLLVIIVLVLKNGGFFQLFNQAISAVGNNQSTDADFSTGFGGTSEGGGASGSW